MRRGTGRIRLRHPDPETLRTWLAGDANDDIERHIESCSHCAAVMEELESGPKAGDEGLRRALANALAPPADLTERLIDGVNERLSSRQMMSLVADLFAAGFQTSRMLLIEEDDDA